MSLTRLSLDGLTNRASMNLLGAGELFTTGSVFYVDSNNGSDGNLGTDPAAPKASIDNANNSCTADVGDIIVAMPNHTETVSAAGGLTLDTDGVTVIGLGSGDNRPQINFTTATGADMDVDGNSVTLVNLHFTGGIDALTGPIDINGDDTTIVDCEYEDVTGQTVDAMIVTGDGTTIQDYKHTGASGAGGQSAIQLNGTTDTTITDFRIDGNFGTGAIESVTADQTNLHISGGRTGGFIRTRNSTDIAIVLRSSDSGDIGPNLYFRLADNAANITEAISSGSSCHFFDPIYVVNNDDERGLQWNGTQSTDA